MQADVTHTTFNAGEDASAVLPQDTSLNVAKNNTQNTPAAPHSQYDPDGMIGYLVRFSKFWSEKRKAAIDATPAFIVNNSSNILGAAHVATEMMMFKASSKEAKLIQNPSNPINWVKEPIQTVFVDTFNRSRSTKIPVKELLFKGNPITNIYSRITDVDAATQRVRDEELKKPLAERKSLEKISLSNPWQTRSTLAGLIVWGLSALIPERREDDTEIERMAVKQQVNPLGYIAERLKQAVWIPEWPEHKRQMIGLGIMVSGVCSSIGSWRARNKDPLTGIQSYTFNKAYLGTSLFTLASSLPLLFATDDRRGYGGFGALMMGRLLYLPGSIYKKFKNNEPGKEWYTLATGSFQAENLAQNLIGGAEKLPDGTVVDHEEIRKHAKQKAKEIVVERKKQGFGEEAPDAVIHSATSVEKAMPERVEQHEKLRVAAG